MSDISVVVVDDHPLFRQGVINALSLEPGFRVIGEAASGPEALDLIQRLKPDVAILDINLPGMNGQQVTHRLAQDLLPTRVLLLTAYDDNEQVIHAAWSGAKGYCAKDVNPDWLKCAVREIMQGHYVMGDRILTRREFETWLTEETTRAQRLYSEPGAPFQPLSRREMEVLGYIVRGLSNKEIAAAMGISPQTVKNHITSILRKFGVEDRTQAVIYALRHGWVRLNSDNNRHQE
jgi:DNA-binding NarL/FixJ family response regulator